MDLSLFSALVRNLLSMNVLIGTGGDAVYQEFERKFCYNPVLQPAFTAASLSRLASAMEDRTIYGLQDLLGICLYLFRLDGQNIVVGPFARREFDEERVRRLLIAHRIPASYISSIRLFCEGFPLIGATSVRVTLLAFIRSFTAEAEDYRYVRIPLTDGAPVLPETMTLREESLDYSALYSRYDLENNFLRLIEHGDTETVLAAFRDMNLQGMKQERYVNAVYQNPAIGLAMLRALARKAAERGGASLVEIHEITQRTVQRMSTSAHAADLVAYTTTMVYELTDAVKRSKTAFSGVSSPVRKVVEYIHMNYSQELSLSLLAEKAALSESYLTKAFKREMGVSVFQYIAQLRCREAAELLRGGDIPIQDISSYVGYDDNNYFVKVFRKHYGMTPSEYRASK